MQAKAITKTTVETTGLDVSLSVQEAKDVIDALTKRGVPALFDTVEAMREALGMVTIDFQVMEAIGDGHYDNDLLDGRRIKAIKRLRELFPILGLVRSKRYMDARHTLLTEANREIAGWERELLSGQAAAEDVYRCGICGVEGGH